MQRRQVGAKRVEQPGSHEATRHEIERQQAEACIQGNFAGVHWRNQYR